MDYTVAADTSAPADYTVAAEASVLVDYTVAAEASAPADYTVAVAYIHYSGLDQILDYSSFNSFLFAYISLSAFVKTNSRFVSTPLRKSAIPLATTTFPSSLLI